jgi:HlyD family secretion protein
MKTTVWLVVVLALGCGGIYYIAYGRPAAPPQIVQASVSAGTIVEEVQTTGTLEPRRTVPVGSQVSGIVTALFADFNSIVRKDQVIAQLDRSLFELHVDVQNANYERQLGEIASQELQLDHAKTQLDRAQALFDKTIGTQEQLDQATLAVKTRATTLESARKQLLTAKANLDQATLNLSYTTIRSPIDGVVVSRDVEVGEAVQSSVNVAQFFNLATDLRHLKLTAAIDEAEIGKVRPGLRVAFTVDAYPNASFVGTVESVQLNATATSNVVTYPVVIDTENPEFKLRPGMTATVRILTSTAENVARLPNQALRFRPTPAMYTALGLTPPAATPGRSLGSAGSGGGGVNSRAPGSGHPPQPTTDEDSRMSGKIDELFQRPPSRVAQGRVWVWDASAGRLTEVPVTTGVSDGTYSEIISGDLEVGQQVVTGVLVAQAGAQPAATNSTIFGGRGVGGPPGGFGGGG